MRNAQAKKPQARNAAHPACLFLLVIHGAIACKPGRIAGFRDFHEVARFVGESADTGSPPHT